MGKEASWAEGGVTRRTSVSGSGYGQSSAMSPELALVPSAFPERLVVESLLAKARAFSASRHKALTKGAPASTSPVFLPHLRQSVCESGTLSQNGQGDRGPAVSLHRSLTFC